MSDHVSITVGILYNILVGGIVVGRSNLELYRNSRTLRESGNSSDD